MKIYRWLYPQLKQDGSGKMTHKTFWGIRKLLGGGWRFGFGIGFVEWGTGTSGVFLPRKELKS